MLNSLEVYADAGKKAAIAMNQRDHSRAQSHHDWFNRAKRLEQEDDRRAAHKAFTDAYSSARVIGRH